MTFIISNSIRFVKSIYKHKEYMLGISGFLINGLICMVELISGLVTNNMALLADSFHNAMDSVFAIITLLSFYMIHKPSTIEYPFGFGRIEYLGAFFLGIIMIGMGLHFMLESIEKSVYPTDHYFNPFVFLYIGVSVLLKLLYGFLTYMYAKQRKFAIFHASCFDSLTDAVALSLIAISCLIPQIAGLQTEGAAGIIVSLGIVWSGYIVLKPAALTLIGQKPDSVVVNTIRTIIQKDDRIQGCHSLLVHDYGVGNTLASVHIEVPASFSLIQAHQMSKRIEQDAQQRNIYLTIHVDPIEIQSL